MTRSVAADARTRLLLALVVAGLAYYLVLGHAGQEPMPMTHGLVVCIVAVALAFVALPRPLRARPRAPALGRWATVLPVAVPAPRARARPSPVALQRLLR